jgi:hypothetical protein
MAEAPVPDRPPFTSNASQGLKVLGSRRSALPNEERRPAGSRPTHMTVPGPLNFHQSVNRWLLERQV